MIQNQGALASVIQIHTVDTMESPPATATKINGTVSCVLHVSRVIRLQKPWLLQQQQQPHSSSSSTTRAMWCCLLCCCPGYVNMEVLNLALFLLLPAAAGAAGAAARERESVFVLWLFFSLCWVTAGLLEMRRGERPSLRCICCEGGGQQCTDVCMLPLWWCCGVYGENEIGENATGRSAFDHTKSLLLSRSPSRCRCQTQNQCLPTGRCRPSQNR